MRWIKSSGMHLTNSVSGLSWLTCQMPFLSSLLPQCSLAGVIIRGFISVAVCEKRGPSLPAKETISCPAAWTTNVCEICPKVCGRTFGYFKSYSFSNSFGKSPFLNFSWKVPFCRKRQEKQGINIWSRIVRSVQHSK